MKAASLRFLAGTGGVLVVAGAAPGAFSGIIVIPDYSHQFDVARCRVYAQFSDPDDRLVAVGGTPNAPLEISVAPDGTFYQHGFGSDLAPNPGLIEHFPSLAYDTFVAVAS